MPATSHELARLRRDYFLMLALRWLPISFGFPVVILLPLERGFSLAQIGLAAAAQGVIVLLLGLPTGGLADTLGDGGHAGQGATTAGTGPPPRHVAASGAHGRA